MEAMLCGAVPIQSDTACLPDSLLVVNPSSFVPKASWSEAGQILTRLDSDLNHVDGLSKAFSVWAHEQQLSAHKFRSLMSESYGLL